MAVPSKSDSSRRSRLRSATAAAHQRLDGIVEGGGFLTDRVRYTAYLHATLRARRPIEASLDVSQAERVFPAWPTRRIADALRADLADLGSPAGNAEGARFNIDGDGGVIGVLYVLEGSALGARVLSQRAADLGLGSSFGARHLATQTENPAAWRAFLEILEALPFGSRDDARCLEGAHRTFQLFESELTNASSAP
jgi:heme oxygenase